MKTKNSQFPALSLAVVAMLAILNAQPSTALAQGSAFTYQGRLNTNGSPASGSYDFRFKLYTDPYGNNQVGTTQVTNALPVSAGLFLTTLDFGAGIFTGSNCWLEVDVRTNGAGGYTVLAPMQAVMPTPYAIMAISASNLLGTLPLARLGSGTASISISGSAATANNFSGSLAGDVTGTQSANTVSTVGGQTAANVASGASAANNATSANTAGRIVQRDGSGNFSAGSATLGNLNLPTTSASAGIIYSGGSPFIHGYGNDSFFAGSYAGNTTMTGAGGNTAIGWEALFSNTTGSNNIATGAAALNHNTTGYDNTANGYWALLENTSGSCNTANGYNALYWNGTGSFNTGCGQQALALNNNGTNNIAIGYQAGYNVLSDNNIEIGNAGASSDSGVIRIGTPGTHTTTLLAGNVGIGTTSPDQELTIYRDQADWTTIKLNNPRSANNAASSLHFYQGASEKAAVYYVNSGNNVPLIGANGMGVWNWAGPISLEAGYGGNPVYFNVWNGGNVGIGTASPGSKLVVQADDTNSYADAKQIVIQGNANTSQQLELGYKTSGNYGSIQAIQQNSGYKPLVLQPVGGNVGIGTTTPGYLLVVGGSGNPAYCNGTTWQNGSDRNSKEAFTAINPRAVLEKISALPITEWKYKTEADGDRHIGPMAQDFHAAFGLNGADDKHISTVDEGGVALAAIQALNEKLEQTHAENAKLKTRLERLEKLLNQTSK